MNVTPLLDAVEQAELHPGLREIIDYRKSGLSLNHIIGCPLDCGYCVRHLFDNFDMKKPRRLCSDEEAVEALCTHRFFQAGVTPLQLFNRATDPFVPAVKPHTFRILELLAERQLTNHVLVITRFRVTPSDAARLNSFLPLKVTLLVTYSGIDDRAIEPVDSEIAVTSLRTAYSVAENFRVVLYWRPLIVGVNDTSNHISDAIMLSQSAHATAFTGLFHRSEMAEHYTRAGVRQPYEDTARRKVLPSSIDERVTTAFAAAGVHTLFRKTSCAVAFAHKRPDWNGHYGIRELCDICPEGQRRRCKAHWNAPTPEQLKTVADRIGVAESATVTERAIVFPTLREELRYYIQHSLTYQVHSQEHPHHPHRHGRADIGWGDEPSATEQT